MIRLFNCDNMDFMKSVPDKFYDLAIVDPEYGISVNHNMGRRKWDKPSKYKEATWDKESVNREVLNEIFRVSVNQIIFGANHFISKMPYDSSCWIMWDKGFSEEVTFAQFELAWTSFESTCKKFEFNAAANRDRIHPTQKPISLYKWLLKNYAKEGDKIFDSHGGSLSIAIACGEMGFDLDACELDGDYFKESVARVQRHFTQSNAFMKTPEILVNP